jgi:hypothetical protein
MPYNVFEIGPKDKPFCVYEHDSDGNPVGKPAGCHATRREADRQRAALYANEHKSFSMEVLKVQGGDRRLMVIRSSNAYIDREKEIVKERALKGYVDSCWKDGEFVHPTPLLVWHAGEPIGDIVFSDMIGPFLVEVAQERPDHVVNLADEGEPPMTANVKAIWDWLENEKELGASIKFAHLLRDKEDGEYDLIDKVETSVLPRWAAANYITDTEIFRRPTQ